MSKHAPRPPQPLLFRVALWGLSALGIGLASPIALWVLFVFSLSMTASQSGVTTGGPVMQSGWNDVMLGFAGVILVAIIGTCGVLVARALIPRRPIIALSGIPLCALGFCITFHWLQTLDFGSHLA